MPSEKLTAKRLRDWKPPRAGVVDELLDPHARGLSLRVFPSGRMSWTFRYRSKDGGVRRRMSLGEYPSVGIDEAHLIEVAMSLAPPPDDAS